MIYIKEKSIAEAWRRSFKELYKKGAQSEGGEFYKFSHAVIEISDPYSSDLYDDNFPISQENIRIINNYLVTGENEDEVVHDWTKLYRKRMFAEDYNQIENIIEYLKKKPTGKRAQASVWNQQIDLYGNIGPCLQIIWLQIIDRKLEMHVHMRAVDCYGKLLMNIDEFISLQNYISQRLDVKSGSYVQFVDSLHFNLIDKEKIDLIFDKI